jgi:gamma-glutamyltranspeptidase/glutathione hydrolase
MVATSQPLAAQAGLHILKQGGNAVDAAIATNAALGVVEPMMCGIGGDLFAIIWDGKQLHGLNGSGRSPHAATRDRFANRGWKQIPLRHPYSWSVPGCVHAWFELHKRFGRLDFVKLLGPAIDYAANGFPVTEVIAGSWQGSESLLASLPGGGQAFLKNGRAPCFGERMKNPDLAHTYQLIAHEGPDVFYKGKIAEKIAAFSETHGGLFSLRDFVDHTSTWVAPVGTRYRGYDVWELPPNGQGIAALEMLNVLEESDVAGMDHNGAEFLHLFIEAKKLAFSDRATYYADPEVERNLPITELISKAYGKRQAKRIDVNSAALEVPAGDPRLAAGDTIYLTAADEQRNIVSLIQSTYYPFGTGHVPDALGFALQNRGTLFALDDTHHNRLEPHKRPFHTIIPAMVTRDGRPWLSFGVMGGDMQPQGHVQILVNMIDHKMNVQQAGDAARCRHYGSSGPTGTTMTDGGEVIVEPGIGDEAIQALRAKGHRIRQGRGGFGGYQGIMVDPETNVLHGGSDPRKDGMAVGF